MLQNGQLKNIDFPKFVKDQFGITAVEYVNGFLKDQIHNQTYLTELKHRTNSEGIQNVLIMCDGLGQLAAANNAHRLSAINNHKPWIDVAKFLGCHSIRVNLHGEGSNKEVAKQAIDSLSKLSEFAKPYDMNIIVENHGGKSSNGKWLAHVLRQVNMIHCGSLPDFGNFKDYDRYQGVKELMPFAKGVSAKSHDFNKQGEEIHTDFLKIMRIVKTAGYTGYVGIEYEGHKLNEIEGIKATQALLQKVATTPHSIPH